MEKHSNVKLYPLYISSIFIQALIRVKSVMCVKRLLTKSLDIFKWQFDMEFILIFSSTGLGLIVLTQAALKCKLNNII